MIILGPLVAIPEIILNVVGGSTRTVLGAGWTGRTPRGLFLSRTLASQEPVLGCGTNTGGSLLTAAVSPVAPSRDFCQCPPLPPLPLWVWRLQVFRAVGSLAMLP